MARGKRIGNVERLIIALRENDTGYIRELRKFPELASAIIDYKSTGKESHRRIYNAMGDLIEEAMEGGVVE